MLKIKTRFNLIEIETNSFQQKIKSKVRQKYSFILPDTQIFDHTFNESFN